MRVTDQGVRVWRRAGSGNCWNPWNCSHARVCVGYPDVLCERKVMESRGTETGNAAAYQTV